MRGVLWWDDTKKNAPKQDRNGALVVFELRLRVNTKRLPETILEPLGEGEGILLTGNAYTGNAYRSVAFASLI